MMTKIDKIYNDQTRKVFGSLYCPPVEGFDHGKWYTVAHFKKNGGDGQSVEIDECRWPAQFFRLRAIEDTNSMRKPKPPFTLSTGSGLEMGKLMVELAKAIINGMVGLHS